MYQNDKRSNRAHLINGEWMLLWMGDYTPMSEAEALSFNAQEPEVLKIGTSSLTGHALAWAVATAVGYTPHFAVDTVPGKMLGGGVVQRDYEDQVVIATYIPRKHFGPFRPVTDYAQGGPLLDKYRVSTEIAGDGWGALLNDTFCSATLGKVVHGESRLEAGLRCIVEHFLGPVVDVPAELVPAPVRRRMLTEAES
jgi:hypothetical protein